MLIGINELAKKIGVSRTTVSLVLNGKSEGQVSEKRRTMILDVARRYGVRIDSVALALRSQTSHTIAIIYPAILNLFYSELINEINSQVVRNHYMPLFFIVGEQDHELEHVLEKLRTQRFDGIISFYYSPELAQYGKPVVVENYEPHTFNSVKIDFTKGLTELVDFLADHDYRSLGYLGDTRKNRFQILQELCVSKGITFQEEHILGFQFSADCYEKIHGFLKRRDLPEVMVCSDDDIAQRAICAAAQLGIKIPQQLAIVGMDNNPSVQYLNPPLTTIATNMKNMAELTVRELLAHIEDKARPVVHRLVETSLVVRQSLPPKNI